MLRSMWRLLPALALVGCGGGGTEGGRDVRALLQPLAGCSAVEGALRDSALRQMERELAEAEARYLANGGGCVMEDVPAAPPSPVTSGAGGRAYSGTNNQVAGVDEADFVKTDGEYLYVAGAGGLRIVDVWPAEQSHLVGRLPLEGTPQKLFVHGDRALVYASLPWKQDDPRRSGSPRECTYGYDCDFTGDGNPTQLTLVDLSVRSNPRVLRTLRTSSSLVSARRVGSTVHSVLASRERVIPDLRTHPEELPWCSATKPPREEVRAAFRRLREENTRKIREASFADLRPSLTDSQPGGEPRELLAQCEGFLASEVGDGAAFTTLLSFDLGTREGASATTVVSRPGAVYASAESLYVAVPHRRSEGAGWFTEAPDSDEASTVHKFHLEGATSRYAASGLVKGRVLNQFAMDEHAGALRVATTSGHAPSPETHSTLSVLRERGGALETAGRVDGLAPSEDIRAVRFAGDRGYVVTFKKTDPLFVFDLSDAEHPRVRAELKIPGFSTYIHRLGEDHLLTVGYDAADQGDFAFFTGVLLQIFDVTDASAPRLVHRESIGTRGSSSEALTNHLAFTYYEPRKLLLLPMTVCEGGTTNGGFGTQPTFSGLMAWEASAAGGFSSLGGVSHPLGTDVSCSNWWTQGSSQVRRSIVLEDYVLSLSDTQLKVNRLGALSQDLAAVPLAD